MFTYFNGSQDIWRATKESPIFGLELIFKPIENCSIGAQKFAEQLGNPIHSLPTLAIFRIAGFIGIFCFGTYLPIALFFSLLAFMGTWRIFLVFYKQYPEYHKPIALGCLFAPSALLWGTNILKDPVCIYALGLCVTGLFTIVKGRLKLINLVQLLIGSIILLVIKDYIFYIFLSAVLVSFLIMYKSRHPIIKIAFRLLTILGLVMFIFWANKNIEFLGNLMYTNFTKSALNIQNAQTAQIDEGASGYVLTGINDFSAWGVFKTYLQSLNVALFRPYIWEVRNPLMLLNALESFTVLLFSIYLLIKTKLIGFFAFAVQKPVLLFALIFSLLLAPLVGFVSFNFGTLLRYKIPMVPFFYTYLFLLFIHTKANKNQGHE